MKYTNLYSYKLYINSLGIIQNYYLVIQIWSILNIIVAIHL